MLKIVSRIACEIPAARSAANEEPYSTIRRSPRFHQTSERDVVHVGAGAGRDRGEADRRQRGEDRRRRGGTRRARRGSASAGARPLSTARSNAAGVIPSTTIRTSFFGICV